MLGTVVTPNKTRTEHAVGLFCLPSVLVTHFHYRGRLLVKYPERQNQHSPMQLLLLHSLIDTLLLSTAEQIEHRAALWPQDDTWTSYI